MNWYGYVQIMGEERLGQKFSNGVHLEEEEEEEEEEEKKEDLEIRGSRR